MNQQLTLAASFSALLALAGCGAGSTEGPATTLLASSSQTSEMQISQDPSQRISSGVDHIVSLHADGTVFTWGGNRLGQLGNDTFLNTASPVRVLGLSAVKAVQAGGYHATALQFDGTVWSWGNNAYGQLGLGRAGFGSTMPVRVPGVSNVKAVSAGYLHSNAVTHNGTVWGWGNLPGRTDIRPTPVTGLNFVVATVVAGNDFNLASSRDGALWGWGGNAFGQLGIGGKSKPVSTPTPVRGLSGVVAASAGFGHALAMKADGSVWAWGQNTYDQLGVNKTDGLLPRQVSGLPTPANGATGVKLIAGVSNSAVVYADGSVWIWGRNIGGLFGTNATSATPVNLSDLPGVASVTLGDGFLLILKKDGSAYGIGRNASGQLGSNTTADAAAPVRVTGVGGVGYLDLDGHSSKP